MYDFDDTQPSRRAKNAPPDPGAPTLPSTPPARPDRSHDPLANFQAIRIEPTPAAPLPAPPPPAPPSGKQPRPRRKGGCGLILLVILGLLAVYILFPLRTNIVVFGIDARTPGDALARSDTLILTTFKPAGRYVGYLSIPRDLWVSIPGVGENRINTAHFFAEAALPGSGPQAVKAVIEANFGVRVHYYVRFSFESFKQLIDALGGVQVTLDTPLGDYPAGPQVLDAEQALAFVRDRTSGGDDFSRMRQAQILLRGLVETVLTPANLSKWPELARITLEAVETDVPVFWRPRLAIAVLLALPDGLDGRVLSREMVSPFTTDQGAQVLGPRWDLILPMMAEMFEK